MCYDKSSPLTNLDKRTFHQRRQISYKKAALRIRFENCCKMSQDQFTFRRAEKDDIKAVREMIQELADFERMSNGPELSEADLIRDSGLDGGQEFCHIYVLIDNATNLCIGYAICFNSYSTWQGRSLFLEDIYVRPAHRKRGAGARIFREVAAIAVQLGCRRLDFHVLGWNPAREFYDRLGATNLTESEEWHFYRVEQQQLAKLTSELNSK
ncbi:thialysine N-epsilon-acetyltransferase [Drosophila sulfurigaster albostrigata]|uniref:thialysine N-epsilon-acetyltransferase n=1 Tax=Drosophila sulfurigaster albostrigata TaxID=89887 RepID=UPI002D218496|nr:thialysine N-epsilon-acetyltransferase [Drosophila sulfurigaster albostrigata]